MTKSASREKNTLIIQLRLLMRSCPKVPEQSAPPTVGCLRQPEESSTMIISFSLHNSCSNKMCQVILTKPLNQAVLNAYDVKLQQIQATEIEVENTPDEEMSDEPADEPEPEMSM